MKIISLLLPVVLLSFSSINLAHSEEPFEDYNFNCHATDAATKSDLSIEGGVDPSGGFAIYFKATGRWSQMNRLLYLAKRTPLVGSTKYVSTPKDQPKIDLRINWNQEVTKNSFQGLFRQGKLNGYSTPVLCKLLND